MSLELSSIHENQSQKRLPPELLAAQTRGARACNNILKKCLSVSVNICLLIPGMVPSIYLKRTKTAECHQTKHNNLRQRRCIFSSCMITKHIINKCEYVALCDCCGNHFFATPSLGGSSRPSHLSLSSDFFVPRLFHRLFLNLFIILC